MKDVKDKIKCIACRVSESNQVPENEGTSAVNMPTATYHLLIICGGTGRQWCCPSVFVSWRVGNISLERR